MSSTLFAYDGSGSTGGSQLYHSTSQRIYQDLPKAETTILFWDSAARVIDADDLTDINLAYRGFGGTNPVAVAQYIVDNRFHGRLVLLSDGQVSSSDVDVCDRILPRDWTFSSVRVILVETGGTVNMSVSCPFTRNSPHTVETVTVGYPTPTVVATVTHASIALLRCLDSIDTVADWLVAAPTLEPVVIARTMGTTGDPSLRDRLLELKARIQREEARTKGASSTVTDLQTALATGDTESALLLAAALTREYYGEEDEATDWSAQLNRLVSMCEGALRGTFDLSNIGGAIRSDRARRATTAKAVSATDVEPTEPDLSVTATATAIATATTPAFVCPITLDPTADVVLLIAEAEDNIPLLAGLDKDTANSLTNCPLYIFRFPDVLARLKTRLDHPLSLRALKEAEEANFPLRESPLTRRPLTGAICLGPHTDHSDATNWTLAQLTAGGKKLGNPDLWFAVIWLLVQRGDIPYLAPILPFLTTHLRWRLQNHQAPLSLLGTPEFPTTRVPLAVSLWYAISSSAMTPQPPPARETARAHLPYLDELLTIQEQSGFLLPGPLGPHLQRLRAAMAALSWCKRDEAGFRSVLRALYQSSIQVGDTCTWIAVDGPASSEQVASVMASLPPAYRSLTPADLIAIGRLVNPSKSGSDVVIPYDWNTPSLPVAVTTWAYGNRPISRDPIPICPATCRPYYRVLPSRTQTWEDAARAVFHLEPNQFLPVSAEFGHFVVKHNTFPTKSELLEHLWRRVVAQGKPTLPAQVEGMVTDILRDFAEVMAALSPAEVGRRFLASVKREDRERLEMEVAE